MRLQLEFDFDITNAVEQKFLSWYEHNKQDCKHILILGFMMFDNGMMLYYDEKYKKEVESIWIEKYEKVVLDKRLVEKTVQDTLEEMRMMKSTYEQMYANKYKVLYENKVHEQEALVASLQDEITKREVAVCEQKARETKQLRDENEDLRKQLKEQQSCITSLRDEQTKMIQYIKDEQSAFIQSIKRNHAEEVNQLLTCKERESNDLKTLNKQLEARHNTLEKKLAATEQQIEKVSKQKADSTTKHKQVEIDMLKNQLQLQKKHYDSVVAKATALEKENKQLINSKFEQLERLRNDDYIKQLKDTIIAHQTEIALLKNSNAYKGYEGEQCIKDILSRMFTDCEVKDTSKKGGQSDIHLVTKEGLVVAIESKNKTVITNQDIEKSYNDISVLSKQYGSKLIGYVFISHRTPNIPKKGNLFFERREHLPVVWYGNNDVDMLERGLFVIIKFLLCDKACMTESVKEHDTMQQRLFDAIKSALTVIGNNVMVCQKLQENINTLALNITDMKTNNQKVYEAVMQSIDAEIPVTLSMMTTTANGKYACVQCKQSFKRKCDLTNHIKTTH
jgi:hypothetical protein